LQQLSKILEVGEEGRGSMCGKRGIAPASAIVAGIGAGAQRCVRMQLAPRYVRYVRDSSWSLQDSKSYQELMDHKTKPLSELSPCVWELQAACQRSCLGVFTSDATAAVPVYVAACHAVWFVLLCRHIHLVPACLPVVSCRERDRERDRSKERSRGDRDRHADEEDREERRDRRDRDREPDERRDRDRRERDSRHESSR
jgi:hypothetical protein